MSGLGRWRMDGLLRQDEEAGQSGHVALPLSDKLSIQDVGEGREGHILLKGGRDEHAEGFAMVGQFQDVILVPIRGGELSWEDTKMAPWKRLQLLPSFFPASLPFSPSRRPSSPLEFWRSFTCSTSHSNGFLSFPFLN